jgi:hypothetical protein
MVIRDYVKHWKGLDFMEQVNVPFVSRLFQTQKYSGIISCPILIHFNAINAIKGFYVSAL